MTPGILSLVIAAGMHARPTLLAEAAAAPECRVKGQPTLAIVDVRTTGLPAEMGELLSRSLRSYMVETRCFRVQDQATMKEILVAQQFNKSEVCDESCVVEQGRLLQVRYILMVSVLKAGGGALAIANLTDVETGTAVESPQALAPSADLGDLLEAMRALADKLAGRERKAAGAGFQEGRIGGAAEEPAVAAGPGNEAVVRFESTPPGAVVRVDGALVCQATPCSKRVAVGQREVVMERERYEPARSRPLIARGSEVALTLTPAFAVLSVETTPAGLLVSLNGQPAGRSPLAGQEVDAGNYEVVVDDPCYAKEGERVAVRKGEKRAVSLAPKPRMAAVEVTVADEAGNDLEGEVRVDGAAVGTAPGTFRVQACARTIAVVADGGLRWSQPLELSAGETAKILALVSSGTARQRPRGPAAAAGPAQGRPARRFALRAGLSGHTGVLGVGLEVRAGPVGFALGTGTHLLSGGLSFGASDGSGGFYVDLHMTWVKAGLIVDLLAPGFGLGATAGYDFRPVDWWSIKVGGGLGWSSATSGTRVFEIDSTEGLRLFMLDLSTGVVQ